MASLTEMMEYARAKQPRNTMAEVAKHFLEGAKSGYDAGHAEAEKKAAREAEMDATNPMVENPLTHEKQRLDVVSKLLDVQDKIASIEQAKAVNAMFDQQVNEKEMGNRTTTLANMADTEMVKTAGVAGKDKSTQGKVVNIVDNPAHPKQKPKVKVSMTGGKPTISMEFDDTRKTTAGQIKAIQLYADTQDPAPLAIAFPEGLPDWGAKMLAQAQEHKLKKDTLDSERKKVQREKSFIHMSEALDPSKQRQGAFGVSKQVFDRAERLESLANAFPGGNLRSSEIEELAIGLNSMLSGSNTGAQEQVKALVPKTIWGDGQKLREWLTNEPTGTGQQEFVKRMMGSVAREKETASKQIKRTQLSRISPYAKLEDEDPDTFHATLQSQGIEPEEYQAFKARGYKPESAVVKGGEGEEKSFTPDVVSYAQKHSITPAQALQIKMSRTGVH